MTHKNRKKSRIFMFLGTGSSLLRDEGIPGYYYQGRDIISVVSL